MNDPLFTPQEWLRYTRHIQLPEFGAHGQARLKKASVLMVGMGGLGCPVSAYLTAAGVGHLVLVDGDRIELTNLQRQVLYTVDDIGRPKATTAKQKLRALNPDISIDAIDRYFDWQTAGDIGNIDLVLDCSDNFATRYLINDFCLQYAIPWIYASIHQFTGQCALFTPGGGCFRCVFPAAPAQAEDCNTAGVIGTLPGLLGLLQANEAIKHLAGLETPLQGHLLLVDGKKLSLQRIALTADADCRCRSVPVVIDKHAADYREACAQAVADNHSCTIAPEDFNVLRNEASATLLDVRSEEERRGFHIGGRHVAHTALAAHLSELDKHPLYLCYCQSGKRSREAAELLLQNGFKARSLAGGLAAWLTVVT